MGKPWFRVKRYGFGAGVPCSWQGWALLGAFTTLIIASALLNEARPLLHFGVVLASTAIVIVVSWRKSDGAWKWRWGRE